MDPSSFKNFIATIKSNYKIVWVYAVLVMVASFLIALACSLVLSPANIYWIKGAQLLLFILAGIMHCEYLQRKVVYLNWDNDTDKLYFSIFLSVLIGGALSALYLSIDRNLITIAFASASAFLFPAFLTLAFNSFIPSISAPENQVLPWFVDSNIDDRVSIFLNSLQLELQLAQKDADNAETIYNLTLPGQTPFGRLFNRFVFETNKKEAGCIETNDKRRKPFGWEFYVEILGGLTKKQIDPMLTLRENRIKKNSIIIARRMGTSRKKQQRLLSGLSTSN